MKSLLNDNPISKFVGSQIENYQVKEFEIYRTSKEQLIQIIKKTRSKLEIAEKIDFENKEKDFERLKQNWIKKEEDLKNAKEKIINIVKMCEKRVENLKEMEKFQKEFESICKKKEKHEIRFKKNTKLSCLILKCHDSFEIIFGFLDIKDLMKNVMLTCWNFYFFVKNRVNVTLVMNYYNFIESDESLSLKKVFNVGFRMLKNLGVSGVVFETKCNTNYNNLKDVFKKSLFGTCIKKNSRKIRKLSLSRCCRIFSVHVLRMISEFLLLEIFRKTDFLVTLNIYCIPHRNGCIFMEDEDKKKFSLLKKLKIFILPFRYIDNIKNFTKLESLEFSLFCSLDIIRNELNLFDNFINFLKNNQNIKVLKISSKIAKKKGIMNNLLGIIENFYFFKEKVEDLFFQMLKTIITMKSLRELSLSIIGPSKIYKCLKEFSDFIVKLEKFNLLKIGKKLENLFSNDNFKLLIFWNELFFLISESFKETNNKKLIHLRFEVKITSAIVFKKLIKLREVSIYIAYKWNLKIFEDFNIIFSYNTLALKCNLKRIILDKKIECKYLLTYFRVLTGKTTLKEIILKDFVLSDDAGKIFINILKDNIDRTFLEVLKIEKISLLFHQFLGSREDYVKSLIEQLKNFFIEVIIHQKRMRSIFFGIGEVIEIQSKWGEKNERRKIFDKTDLLNTWNGMMKSKEDIFNALKKRETLENFVIEDILWQNEIDEFLSSRNCVLERNVKRKKI